MKEDKKNRSRWLHVRLTPEEHLLLNSQFKSTTERKLSGYIRKVILAKPMIGRYRNDSLEDIVAVLTRLGSDLNGLANNYNQAVKKLNAYQQYHELAGWISAYKKQQQELLDKIGEIHLFIAKTAREWLQS
jgi:hypothetical protein